MRQRVGPSRGAGSWRARWGAPLISALLVTGSIHAAPTEAARGSRKAPDEAGPIHFEDDFESVLGDALRDAQPVVVLFGADWCPNCRRLRTDALASPEVLALADRFRWVAVDIDRHLSRARDYEVDAIPQTLVLDGVGRARVRIIGAVSSADFREALASVLPEAGVAAEGAEVAPEIRRIDPLQTPLTFTPEGYRGRSICFSHVGYGPLGLDTQSPFQALRLGLGPRTPSTLGRGDVEVRTSTTWANIWANGGSDYQLDFETLDLSVAVAYGLSDVLQLEAAFEDRSRFGGEMDGFIQGFHDLFGIEQNGRDQVAKGLFRFELDPGDGRPPVSLDASDRGSFSRNVQVALQHNVSCGRGRRPAFAWAFTARLETADGEDLDGGRPLDLGASASISRRFGPFYGYLTLAFSRFGRDSFRGIALRTTQLSGLAALEWRFRPTQSLLLQYLVSEGVAEDLGPFSRMSNELTLGWKGEVAPGTVVEFGHLENLVEFDNSADFGVHLGLSHRY